MKSKIVNVPIDCDLIKREQRNHADFKSSWKMKEATNKEEAVISILDVLTQNPVWLNKCDGELVPLLVQTKPAYRSSILKHASWELVKDLFIEVKTQYYSSIDYSTKF